MKKTAKLVITAFFILSSFFMQATAKGIAANGDDEVSKWGKFRFLPDREYYSNYDIARTWYLVSPTGNFSRVIYTFDDLTDCCFVRFDDTHAFIFKTSNYDPIERFQLFNAEGQLSENEFRNLEIDYSRELLFPYPIFNMNCDGGYIDQDGNWSIQPQYLDISPFVRMDSFNAGHREIMQLNPDKIRDGTLVALVLEGENYKIINTENETLYYIGRYDSGRLTDTILDILDF